MASLFCFLKPNFTKNDYRRFEKIGVLLPPIFKSFCNNFELGTQYDYLHKLMYDDNQIDGIGNFYFESGESEYQWDGFISLDELYEQYLQMLDINDRIVFHQEEYFDGKLFYIGMLSSSFYLYVGTYGEAQDKIYIHSTIDGLFKVAENIFEFCHKFEYKVFDYEFAETSKLYKNWGEDFWRVREKEE